MLSCFPYSIVFKIIRMKNQNQSNEERDWKYLSSIKNELLEKCSRQGNDQIRRILADSALSENEKRLKIYQAVRDHDRLIADCFDMWSRSRIFEKVLLMRRYGILEDRYFRLLSEEKRISVEKCFEIYK